MFYIYAYLRSDGTPYYIGKGKANRAWKKNRKDIIKPPKDKSRIVIMENNLTELGAFALERFYIRWYGRKDLGTGILRNGTEGGDGLSSPSKQSKEKMAVNRGKKLSKEWIENRTLGQSKSYQITYPNGDVLVVKNLKQFCEKNGLFQSNMYKVAKGLQEHHRGLKCRMV